MGPAAQDRHSLFNLAYSRRKVATPFGQHAQSAGESAICRRKVVNPRGKVTTSSGHHAQSAGWSAVVGATADILVIN